METIRNPLEWGVDKVRQASRHAASIGQAVRGEEEAESLLAVRRIEIADLVDALRRGVADFMACRTDVMFACLLYPAVGLLLARFAFQYDMLPLLFPLASGFVLIGPVAAIGLYDMSRHRERGEKPSWLSALRLLWAPQFGTILVLALAFVVVFAFWLLAAQLIYNATLGPEPPASISAFLGDLLTTAAGWTMIIVGCGIGFVFALAVLVTSVISFPLLIDRNVGIRRAVLASLRAARANPIPILAWGAIVAAGLVVGSIPLFLGLIFVMPILGHATWHLYRKLIAH